MSLTHVAWSLPLGTFKPLVTVRMKRRRNFFSLDAATSVSQACQAHGKSSLDAFAIALSLPQGKASFRRQ